MKRSQFHHVNRSIFRAKERTVMVSLLLPRSNCWGQKAVAAKVGCT